MERIRQNFYTSLNDNTISVCEDAEPWRCRFFEHSHPFCELLLFLYGEAEMVVDGKAIPLKENDLLIIPKGVRHYIRILKNAPYARSCIHVEPDMLRELGLHDLAQLIERENVYMANLTDTHYVKSIPQITQTASRMISNRAQSALYYERLLSLYHSLPPLQENKSEPVRLFDKARLYIEANLEKELTLAILAENFFVSPAYLCKVFRKETGLPVMHYVNERRIRKAKQLILEGTSMKEVHLSCGYENYVTFFRVFRKLTGQTPSQFRQSH